MLPSIILGEVGGPWRLVKAVSTTWTVLPLSGVLLSWASCFEAAIGRCHLKHLQKVESFKVELLCSVCFSGPTLLVTVDRYTVIATYMMFICVSLPGRQHEHMHHTLHPVFWFLLLHRGVSSETMTQFTVVNSLIRAIFSPCTTRLRGNWATVSISPLCIGLKINAVVHRRVRVCRKVRDPTTSLQLWVVS